MAAPRMVLFAIMLTVAACSTETVAPPPKPPIGSLEPALVADAGRELVTARERALPVLYARALNSSSSDGGPSFSGLAPLLNPDLAEFSSPGMPPAHESAGIVAAHDTLFGAFDDRVFALSRVWRTANEQSVEWVMTGTQARGWMGVAATHKRAAFRGLTLLWTKDDGTIVDIHVYFDVGLVKVQLSGVGPKELVALPPAAPPDGPAQVFEQAEASSGTDLANVAVVKAWLGALEDGKEPDYLKALTDDIEIATLESATPMNKDDAKKYFRASRKAIGQLDTTVNNAWGVGEFAIVEYDIDGEQLGPFSWTPLLAAAPVKPIQLAHFDLVDVCQIRDGKIARVWRYDNPAQVLAGFPPSSRAATAGARP